MNELLYIFYVQWKCRNGTGHKFETREYESPKPATL